VPGPNAVSSRLRRGLSRRRVGAALVALGLGLGVIAGPISADEITDTRSEAARIADRIEELRHEAEVLTEQYLDAQLARRQLDERITAARRRAQESETDRDALGSDLRQFAVESYMDGGGLDSGAAAVLGAGDANDIGRRRGYARAVSSDGADLSDRYRGAADSAAEDAATLQALLDRAEQAEADIAERRNGTEERIAELQELEDEISGRLRQLVQAEQERREAERRRAAEEAARRAPPPPPAPPAPAPDTDDRAADPDAPVGDAPDEPDPEPPAPTGPTPPAPDPEPPAPAGPTSGAAAAVAAAHTVLGTPYRWAGASPSGGFDCSGLILWAWAHGGKSLPHSSRALYAMSRKIPVEQLQPGDLVFYNSPISHVGLYIGGGQMIHAPHTGDVVKISSIHYWSALVGGGRI